MGGGWWWEPFGEGKSLLALAVAEEVQHECSHQGCTKRTPLDQIEQHEKECKWRQILCPGKGCTAMIPFCEVEDHAQRWCCGCEWPPKDSLEHGIGRILTKGFDVDRDDGNDFAWDTDLIQYEGKLFFCRVFNKNGIFTVDVVMKGSLEECRGFLIEAAILDANSDEVEPAVEAKFPPRPLKEDNKPGFCLTVPFSMMSEVRKFSSERFYMQIQINVVKLE